MTPPTMPAAVRKPSPDGGMLVVASCADSLVEEIVTMPVPFAGSSTMPAPATRRLTKRSEGVGFWDMIVISLELRDEVERRVHDELSGEGRDLALDVVDLVVDDLLLGDR